ncbi:MAG: hypothetical protein Ct9H300mP4_12220 [Gammaproteobacteria bacterium]|nr:MAG: hypothetical protein Ct9H300mP4_12220 [Gammaproteobacteria bacterium]
MTIHNPLHIQPFLLCQKRFCLDKEEPLFNVPVTWYGRPLGSAFPSPLSPKDIDQYHLSGVVNINLANDNN